MCLNFSPVLDFKGCTLYSLGKRDRENASLSSKLRRKVETRVCKGKASEPHIECANKPSLIGDHLFLFYVLRGREVAYLYPFHNCAIDDDY